MAEAAAAHGPVTVLVNNAANDQRHTTLEVDEAFWDWSQAINLKAYFFGCQAVIEGMRTAGGGSIINFSSISYMMGNAGYPSYTTANGGINGMTRSLAREFGPDRIRVNALAPGWVLTDKQMELWATPEDLAAHMERMCLKEHLEPADIVGGDAVSGVERLQGDDRTDHGDRRRRGGDRDEREDDHMPTGSPSTGAPRICAPGP